MIMLAHTDTHNLHLHAASEEDLNGFMQSLGWQSILFVTW